MYKCPFCERELKTPHSYSMHTKHCKYNPDRDNNISHENLELICFCRYCGKECKNLNSLRNHERLCRLNPDKQVSPFTVYNESIRRGEIKHWAKGETAETNSSIAKMVISRRKTRATRTYGGWHHSDETKRKIGEASSKNLSEGYASGRLSSPVGVGRGKYSYFVFNGKKHLLRSTWEFLYALYLATQGIDFETESIRVPAITENKYAKTFISDFSYGNKVVEIKGIKSDKDIYLKESFEAAGYEFIELFEKDINIIKKSLTSSGYDIDILLESIKKGSNSKNYFVYTYN